MCRYILICVCGNMQVNPQCSICDSRYKLHIRQVQCSKCDAPLHCSPPYIPTHTHIQTHTHTRPSLAHRCAASSAISPSPCPSLPLSSVSLPLPLSLCLSASPFDLCPFGQRDSGQRSKVFVPCHQRDKDPLTFVKRPLSKGRDKGPFVSLPLPLSLCLSASPSLSLSPSVYLSLSLTSSLSFSLSLSLSLCPSLFLSQALASCRALVFLFGWALHVAACHRLGIACSCM